jgi:hypothetical protein
MDQHHTIVQSAQKTHIEIMTDSVFVLKTGLVSVVTGTLENVILNVLDVMDLVLRIVKRV